jgi:hypothetical protein
MARKDQNEQKNITYRQEVRGKLSLKDVAEINPDLEIKIAVTRDCRVIESQIFRLDAGQTEVEYGITFHHEHSKAIGVRVIVGPGSVPDEQLRSIEHHQQWVPAKSFVEGIADNVDLLIPNRLYLCWLVCCRTYTLRGRVVCRRIVWDRIEQRFTICDAPVRGAKVTAFDVDRFWWLCRSDEVGSDFTDLNGNFEITFTWCCWWWRPWFFRDWRLDPDLVVRIRELLEKTPFTGPIPRPEPVLDFTIFERMVTGTNVAMASTALPGAEPVLSSENFARLGEVLVERLPAAPDLRELHVWPWWPLFDCRPDIIFKVTQDCGEGEQTIYTETCAQTRWDIDTVLDGVTLVANENACCGPFCCDDPPDEDCLVFHGVGCGSYPIDQIEQNPADPLVGYAYPGVHDRPFGGTIRLLGVFGDGSEVDFYKLQSRRISPAPTGWADVPPDQIGAFSRGYWTGVIPLIQWETVALQDVDGEKVLKTINRYREENPGLPNVDPINSDWLGRWVTATGIINGVPLLPDGVYELRVVGYRYDEANDSLFDQKIMALCPPAGEDVDPADHATFHIRLDNRVSSSVPGSVHLNTTEPDCDFPNICAVVKNEGEPDEECVSACGILRLKAGDTLTIHFTASDSDGHLAEYQLTAHWAESEVFDVVSVGTLAPDPDQLFGPSYDDTFLLGQGAYRAGLLPANPEHDRPFWYGGNFKVTVTVDDLVPSTEHKAFETCCAYLLRLKVWKRTTNGCTGPAYFHVNHCEFSFTVIREDLIGDPAHPSCSELCPEEEEVAVPQAGVVSR